ncbi:MAG: CHRD domain-containing protein [Bacteroidota bacterium]
MKRLLPAVVLFLLVVLQPAAQGQIHFTAVLDGSQEVPAVVTTASGSGSFELSDDMSELRYVITYRGLSGTLSAGGHFHAGKPGQIGGVVRTIASTGGAASATISGTWKSTDVSQPLTAALVESLLTGRVYVNFHTTANPGGEIRGQVNLATSLHFESNLDGSQENPPVVTTAGGTGVFVLDPTRTEVDYWVTYRGLSGPLSAGGHVHTGAPGQSGGVVKTLAASGDSANATVKGSWRSTDGTQPLTPAIVDSMIAGKTYANFHTTAHPGGEIRGRLVLKGGTGFVASLEGSKENPPTVSNATGTGSFILNSAHTQVSYALTYIRLASNLTAGGHIHAGNPARNGGIVKTLAAGGDSSYGTISGTWTTTDVSQQLTPALVESLFTGKLYANFHSSSYPGGEIRSQLDMTTGTGFTARLDGSQENPAVATAGQGTASVVLDPDRNSIHYSVTYFGLSGPLSGAGGHFHVAPAGINGPVVKNVAAGFDSASKTITDDWSTTDVSQPLTAALVDSLVAGKIYMNFHTTAYPGGEIRGQVKFGPELLTSVETAEAPLPETFRLEQNYPNPFNPSTSIRFELPASSQVTLRIYDILGREVATLIDGIVPAGASVVRWDAKGMASGVYLYRLTTDRGAVETRSMILVK